MYDVQVGDVLKLEPGDIVCADGIFIEGHNLKCDESTATGESDAVRKLSWQVCQQRRRLLNRSYSSQSTDVDGEKRTSFVCISEKDFIINSQQQKESTESFQSQQREVDPFLISGSKVIEGICTYMVTAVGPNSFHGRTLMALRTKDENTPLQDKLDVLATSIAKFGLSTAAFLISVLLIRSIVGYATGTLSTVPADIVSHIMQILITTVTVIVVAVPEGLPLAVTLGKLIAHIKNNLLFQKKKSFSTHYLYNFFSFGVCYTKNVEG